MKSALMFLIIIFCGSFAFGYTPSSYYHQKECTTVIQNNVSTSVPGTPSNEFAEAPNKHKEQRDFAATCSDLAAQWYVADISHRNFWLGVIGLLLLWWTLDATRKAAQSTSETLDLARTSTKAEFQPYIKLFEDCLLTPVISGNKGKYHSVKLTINNFSIQNIGKTPISNLTINGQASFKKDEKHFTTEAEITNLNVGDFSSNEIWRCTLCFTFEFPDGGAQMYEEFENTDIELFINFTDMFSEKQCRTYKAHYFIERASFGIRLKSLQEIPQKRLNA